MLRSNAEMNGGVDGGLGNPKSWPPGFRFHPTDEELVLYYLKRKICHRRLKLNVIGEVDVYKWHPEELPGQSLLKSGDRQWYFFTPKDRKYPNGARSNRATRHGYWKTTGKDRNITRNSRTVGLKKTLVFYQGRAPSGERTDWVMHEYTLCEEELKRCKAPQDSSYALYKLYKKSGAGPKNGEQYGAHFIEEEWIEDDDPDDVNAPNPDNQVRQINGQASLYNVSAYDQYQSPIFDPGEIVKHIADEPVINQHPSDLFDYLLPQVGFEEEAHSYMVEPSPKEVISSELGVVLHPCEQPFDSQASFDVTESATSFFLSCKASEIIPASNISEQYPNGNEGDNFLEIDDLIGPEPSFSNTMTNVIQEIDTLDGPDLYFDAAMFLRDMGPINHETTSQPYFSSLGGEMASQFNFQPTSDFGDEDQLWTHEQNCNVFASIESNQAVTDPQTSGARHADNLMPLLSEEKQNQDGGNEGVEQESWFTSALWAFLDSVPTTPAAASENSMINRAFERMSSFGRVQMGSRNTDVVANTGVGATVGRRRRSLGGNGTFFFLSILGVLSAILWMLMIGTVVKVFKTLLGRFIPSS